jgi:hypothetical protein
MAIYVVDTTSGKSKDAASVHPTDEDLFVGCGTRSDSYTSTVKML